MALGSEEDWVSEGLYDGSSKAASDVLPEEDFPSQVDTVRRCLVFSKSQQDGRNIVRGVSRPTSQEASC